MSATGEVQLYPVWDGEEGKTPKGVINLGLGAVNREAIVPATLRKTHIDRASCVSVRDWSARRQRLAEPFEWRQSMTPVTVW